jgi:hypothetical protein
MYNLTLFGLPKVDVSCLCQCQPLLLEAVFTILRVHGDDSDGCLEGGRNPIYVLLVGIFSFPSTEQVLPPPCSHGPWHTLGPVTWASYTVAYDVVIYLCSC